MTEPGDTSPSDTSNEVKGYVVTHNYSVGGFDWMKSRKDYYDRDTGCKDNRNCYTHMGGKDNGWNDLDITRDTCGGSSVMEKAGVNLGALDTGIKVTKDRMSLCLKKNSEKSVLVPESKSSSERGKPCVGGDLVKGAEWMNAYRAVEEGRTDVEARTMECTYDLNIDTMRSLYLSDQNKIRKDSKGVTLFDQLAFGTDSGLPGSIPKGEGFCDQNENINVQIKRAGRNGSAKTCNDLIEEKKGVKEAKDIQALHCNTETGYDSPECACYNISSMKGDQTPFEWCMENQDKPGCNKWTSDEWEALKGLETAQGLPKLDLKCMKKAICSGADNVTYIPHEHKDCTTNVAVCNQLKDMNDVNAEGAASINASSHCNISLNSDESIETYDESTEGQSGADFNDDTAFDINDDDDDDDDKKKDNTMLYIGIGAGVFFFMMMMMMMMMMSSK